MNNDKLSAKADNLIDAAMENIRNLNIAELRVVEIMKKPLLTTQDFSILFQISVRTVPRWAKRENVPSIKICRRIFYPRVGIIKLLKSKLIINDQDDENFE